MREYTCNYNDKMYHINAGSYIYNTYNLCLTHSNNKKNAK